MLSSRYSEKNRRWILIALLFCAAAFTLFYFVRQPKKEVDVIYVCKTEISSNDFWSSILSGAEMAAKDNQVNLKILCPPDELHT